MFTGWDLVFAPTTVPLHAVYSAHLARKGSNVRRKRRETTMRRETKLRLESQGKGMMLNLADEPGSGTSVNLNKRTEANPPGPNSVQVQPSGSPTVPQPRRRNSATGAIIEAAVQLAMPRKRSGSLLGSIFAMLVVMATVYMYPFAIVPACTCSSRFQQPSRVVNNPLVP